MRSMTSPLRGVHVLLVFRIHAFEALREALPLLPQAGFFFLTQLVRAGLKTLLQITDLLVSDSRFILSRSELRLQFRGSQLSFRRGNDAWRMLMTPTLPPRPSRPRGDCAQMLRCSIHTGSQGAVRVNMFRDRSEVNNLEFTFLSLLCPHGKTGRTCAKSAWLKTDPLPATLRAYCEPESIATPFCSRNQKADCPTAPNCKTASALRGLRHDLFRQRNRSTRLLSDRAYRQVRKV